jgi:hypothetical protein
MSFAKEAEMSKGEHWLADFCGCLTNAGAVHRSDLLAQ